MEEIQDSFISHEHRRFKFKLGKILASSLSGFIAGFIVASIIFLSLFDLTFK